MMILAIKFEDRYDEYGGGNVEIEIDLDTKKVMNGDFDGSIFPKVVDSGFYEILDDDFIEVYYIQDYVPSIIPNEYGDYINLEIENGVVTNFTASSDEVLDYFEKNGERYL